MYERKGEFNFVLIGAKSTGKTWYLKHLPQRDTVEAKDDKGTIEYLDIISKPENETQGTSISYTELYFNYKDDRYNIDFQIDDYDGNFVETWHVYEENREYKEKLTEYVKESEGIFIFLPYEETDSNVRFDRMQKETDVFINKIKEEYGEDHSELPIPLIIVVSKWDNSSYFQVDDENKRAKEYIESNRTLKLIKDKLSNKFKQIDIIPLSSAKDHNITLPIRMCLDYTFQSWEDKIEKIKSQEEDLLIYLSGILYDIRFYKDGKYKNMYEDLEKDIYLKYSRKIQTLKSTKDYDEFYSNAYRDTKGNHILDALSSEHIEQLESIRKQLHRKEKLKKSIIGLTAIIIIGIGIFSYTKYAKHQSEIKLYNNIQTEFSNKNYSAVLNSITKYYNEYSNIDKDHSQDIKLLEEQTKAKYRAIIGKVLKKLPENKSIDKAYNIISSIHMEAKEYEVPLVQLSLIQKEFTKLDKIKKAYDTVRNNIDQLSLEALSKEKIDEIIAKKNLLSGFIESEIIQNKLEKKLQMIIKTSLQQDDEDVIIKIIDLSSAIGVSDSDLAVLQEKQQEIELQNQFNEFIRELKKKDLPDSIRYIAMNWNQKYGSSVQAEIKNILDTKYNDWLKNEIKKNASVLKIENIDSYNRIVDYLKKVDSLEESIKRLPVTIPLTKIADNEKEHGRIVSLFQKFYQIFEQGVSTISLTLYAQNGNGLGITSYDDEVDIYIDGIEKYTHTDSNGFSQGRMIFNRYITYKAKKYNLKINEKDTISEDDHTSGSFTITYNMLIELENKGTLLIGLGNVYSIRLNK